MIYLFAFFLVCCLKSVSLCEVTPEIVNLEVNSSTELKNQYASVKDVILFTNKNPGFVDTYQYILNESTIYHIKFYNQKGEELRFERTNSSFLTYFNVYLNERVSQDETFTLVCKLKYANKIVPTCKERRMPEDQLMKFQGKTRFFSKYFTRFSKMDYFFKNDSLIEGIEEPTSFTDNSITYISEEVPTFDSAPETLFFVNNDPLVVIRSLNRMIDVNHFGKITIQDEVVIENIGPRYVGSFPHHLHGRFKKGITSYFYTHLPASAENIQFFDVLGNSSYTQIYHYSNYVTLKFRTRYPLLGGWKSSYILRYQVPTHEHVYYSKRRFTLRIRAIDYVLDDKLIEDAVVRIALPEGARIYWRKKPEMLEFGAEETGCPGGLCIFGRKILVLKGRNLFENYIAMVHVGYWLQPWCLLRAPFVISVYLMVAFTCIIFGKRLLF